MNINPDTLANLMKGKSLTQALLAEKAKISVKSVSRALAGKTETHSPSAGRIAAVFGKESKDLAAVPYDQRQLEADARMKGANYHRTSHYMSGRTMLDYALVEQRYGVSPKSVIDAAPALFTLVAELSLKDRRRRLSAYEATFSAAMSVAPKHLQKVFIANANVEDACLEEEESLRKSDLGGNSFSAESWANNAEDGTDLLIDFLCGLSSDVDAEILEFPGGTFSSIDCCVLQGDLNILTNGDDWAKYALLNRHARIRDIPAALLGDDYAVERAEWLAAQIPESARTAREGWLALDVEI